MSAIGTSAWLEGSENESSTIPSRPCRIQNPLNDRSLHLRYQESYDYLRYYGIHLIRRSIKCDLSCLLAFQRSVEMCSHFPPDAQSNVIFHAFWLSSDQWKCVQIFRKE